MDIILMLIPAALLISSVAFIVFYWSVKSDQYEDMDGEAHRILMDDDDKMIPGNTEQDNEKLGNADKGMNEDKERASNSANG